MKGISNKEECLSISVEVVDHFVHMPRSYASQMVVFMCVGVCVCLISLVASYGCFL